jgi:threonine/homoserine/homoserine lactone efflux protein
MMELLLRGFTIGLAIAAPVGPIGVICIRRTLAFGRLSGFVSGLGAATADAVYGAIAALGLTVLSSGLIAAQDWLRVVGGAFLCYLGVRTIFEKTHVFNPEQFTRSARAPDGAVYLRAALMDFVSTFLLTITNPMTILSFTAIFVSLGAIGTAQGSPLGAYLVVLGVFSGSASWWLFLSGATDFLRARFLRPEVHRWVGRLSGALILAFGLIAIVTGLSAWIQRL